MCPASGWRPLRFPLALFHQLLDFPLDEIALEKAQVIEEKDTVEVIHLVTECPRQKILAFDGNFLPVQVNALQYDFLWPHTTLRSRERSGTLRPPVVHLRMAISGLTIVMS